jgi:hypothetical protein
MTPGAAIYNEAEPRGGITKVHEPQIQIPVRCPECGQESLTCLPVAVVAGSLISGRYLHFSSKCHCAEWEATPADIATMRAVLRTNSIDVEVREAADAGAGSGPATLRRGVYSGTGIVRQIERSQFLRKPPNFSRVEEPQAAPPKAQPHKKHRWAGVGKVLARIREAISAHARRVLPKPGKCPEVRAGR